MRIFVESLRRCRKNHRLDETGITKLLEEGKINQEEFEYIMTD